METLRSVLLMVFYYLLFVPMAIFIRKLRMSDKTRAGGLKPREKEYGSKDFEEIF